MEKDVNVNDEESSMSTHDDDDEKEEQEEEEEEEDDNDSDNDENDVSEPSISKGRRKRKNDAEPKRLSATRSTLDRSASSDTGEAPTDGVEKTGKGKEKLDMSFYKLRWFTFRDYKVKNVNEVIKDNFNNKLSLKWTGAGDAYGGFHIRLYRRKTCGPSAKILPSVETEINIKHNDLMFYFTTDINPTHAFCLCSGHSYTLLNGHTESKFNKTMAKHFMDGNCITSKKAVCIAGPSISEQLTFSPEAVLLISGNYEKIITGLTARIREGTKLAKIICNGKSVLMTLGLKKLQIHKTLDLETFSHVFNLFIEADTNPSLFPFDPILVAALDHAEYIGNPVQIKKLEDKLMEDAQNQNEYKRVYLSHRKVDDWAHSSEIELMHGKNTIERFTSAPTLDAMRENWEHPFDQIKIAFTAKDKTKVKGKLKQFLHGRTMCDKTQYHKVAGKWYWLSAQYHGLLTNRMSIFLKSHLIKHDETGYLPLPWKPQSLPKISTTFEFLSQITREQLFPLLKKKVKYLDQDEKSCLRGLNCKFIKSNRNGVFAELKTCLSQPLHKPNTVLRMMSGLEHAMMVSAKEGQPLGDCIESCSIEKTEKGVLKNKQKEIVAILQKERKVIVSNEVVSPNVPEELSNHIFEHLPNGIKTTKCTTEVIGKEVLCYLRTSCKQIEEDDYNETYQSIPEKDDGSFYMLGDRVQGKRLPELFDVLYYKAEEPAKLYLYHVKKGFGQMTRDACSQIRVSANLLWHDLMDSSSTLPNVMKYRKLALEYKDDGICRIMLKRAMEDMPIDEFKSMFREVSEIVYVYAFMDKEKEDGYLDNVSSMKKLTEESVGVKEFNELKKEGYVDRDGTLTDSVFLTTKESFMKQMKGKLPGKRLQEIYNKMSEQTEQIPSTIAQVELTTLAEEFTKFQCSARRFSLKVCQISTCNT
ncbi:uncharacterized protein LOC110464527 isoform X2 [Mizuhopecten yessoensis]|nr:uncharacterized protein LOC110464527 isoform X2 [Mizuhopecten yessoensis]XP_021375455.1 uncharacterized protein LOC110464527 isoform X2 [Mizuhopecten yessoensis]XP_021375456.1 uncharacterized protein LOC110464527 isoform X2 [Mizuhopecten yessoensis]